VGYGGHRGAPRPPGVNLPYWEDVRRADFGRYLLVPCRVDAPLRLPLKSRFVALECLAGWGRVCGFRNQVEGGLPGHRRFVGADADASIASLALAALDVLPGGSVMVFDTEMRYVLVRGRALFDRGFSSVFLEGRL